MNETPDWLLNTPHDHEYSLTACCPVRVGEDLQRIELTRTEFIALKTHLAAMRGIQTKGD